MKSKALRIGTRGSELALWQARWVEGEIRRLVPDCELSIEIIKTTGDRISEAPLAQIGDTGLFTREIEQALLDGRVDCAVHSLKDLPTELPPGLVLGAVCEREDVRDVFIPHPSNPVRTLLGQAQGATIATGSLRRKSQILARRPDVRIAGIRGNLKTRMNKLAESAWSGMILAHAGVTRLGWDESVGEIIPLDVILPAVGQGAVAVEIRGGDSAAASVVTRLHHPATSWAVCAERALLRRLEGGCQVPIGAFARLESTAAGDVLRMDAMVASLDGRTVVRAGTHGSPEDAEGIGGALAVTLLAGGAETILEAIRTAGSAA